MRLPKVDLKSKLAAMNEKVKKARLPSPYELRDGYLNSSFHKSFQQPLAVRNRFDETYFRPKTFLGKF
jgi:hypothetical protein